MQLPRTDMRQNNRLCLSILYATTNAISIPGANNKLGAGITKYRTSFPTRRSTLDRGVSNITCLSRTTQPSETSPVNQSTQQSTGFLLKHTLHYHSSAHSFHRQAPNKGPVITMSSKKRRHSDSESKHETDKSLQNAVRHASRGSAITRPQQPGTHADAYYRNLYSTEPDFNNLGRQDPDFGAMSDVPRVSLARRQEC